MATYKHFIYLAILSLYTFNLVSQNDTIHAKSSEQADEQINQNIEFLAEQLQSEEGDLSSLIDVWNHYRKNPLNLNTAKKEQLQEMQVLTDIQINHLMMHCEKNGYLLSIYELQSIEGFDLPVIKKLIPFVYVATYNDAAFFHISEMMKDGVQELVCRFQRVLEKQAGYVKPDSLTKKNKPNSYYLGDPNRLFARYRFQYNTNVSAAISGEKDAGEEFFKGTQKRGFDFYSGHIAIRNIKYLKTLVIGDYQATFGQGLTLWQGFAFGKSASPMNIKRYGTGIKSYYSFDENRFFRGVAGTLRFHQFEITGLFSRKKIDAHPILADSLVNGAADMIGVSSLVSGGLHATTNGIADKGTITQTILGGNASYQKRNLHLGMTAQHTLLSAALIKPSTLYNQFDYKGKTNTVIGTDYNYVYKNANLFGEFAMSSNGGKAFCQGLIMAIDPKLTFSVHYRQFDRHFQNLFGNAISENTFPQNEKSLYLGLEARFLKALTFSLYLDQYQFGWLKSGVSAPSSGSDFFAQLNFTPTKKIDMYFRFRQRSKYHNSDQDNLYDYISQVLQYNYRYHVSAQLTPDLKSKSRIEFTHLHQTDEPDENGVAFAQDLIFKKINFPFIFTIRYAVFDTKSYDSRVYVYENDVLYSYSVPALYFKGQRAYLLINWDITRRFEIWFRLAQTLYDNQTTLQKGSLNQINANHKTELKLQARLKF